MPDNNNLPLQQGMLHRPRLHSLIERGLQYPVLVMLAGPGYGKTQAMADYLAQCDAEVIWLRLSSLDNLQAHFWDRLAHVVEREYRGSSGYLQALSFPDTLSKFDVFSQFLTNEICRQKRVVWVFDDFGEIENQKVRDFFRTLADLELENFRLVLISNVLASTESIAFMTSRRFLILGKDLQFTRDEIAELYRMHGIALEADELSEVESYTEGWPLPLHLLMLQHDKMPALISQERMLTHHVVSHMFEERFFSTYPKQKQKLFVKLSLLNSFTAEFANELCEGDKVDADTLENHVFIAREPTIGSFFYHNLYRLFLQKKRYLLDEEEERQVWRRAAEHYTSSGQVMEAITCYRRCGDHRGMLNVICDFVRMQHGITGENAEFFLEHIDLLSPEEARANPVADYLRALIYLHSLELEKAEGLLLDLERRLLEEGTVEALTLLGDAYALQGLIHMMHNQEDFGDYYRRAAAYLPNGALLQNKTHLMTGNNHNFSMADNRPGAKERMERAMHYGVPWINRVMRGGMSGVEYIFSAEAAYLSYRLNDAEQHAYRAIYKAEANAQHDLVCSGYGLLARIGLMQGNFAEVSGQIQSLVEYAEKHEIGTLKDIRDTALGWYYIKLNDHNRIPKSVITMNTSDRSVLAQDRSRIVYANYLIRTGEYAKLVGMLEYPRGLYLTRGIWPDRICLYIMLAIGYHSLEKPDAAVKALWTAYDMSYNNGLTTLFVEAEERMRVLIEAARQQQRYSFDPEWLDLIAKQSTAFAKRIAVVRASYRKQNPLKEVKTSPLTKRETEILRALSQGLTREEIAVEQFISVNTVKTFIRSIYNKLDAANRAEAVSIAIFNGYLDVVARELR